VKKAVISMTNSDENAGRVVVGFDGSEGAKRALRWAADEARLRARPLRVVHAWTPGEFGTDEDQELAAKHRIAEGLSEVGLDGPTPAVECVTQKGHAAHVLVKQTGETDMVVVGSRGHGGFSGLLLGSVGQYLSSHGRASVVVIVRS
jgi:nucleotide-binding universal stress UspA family protein